MQQRSLMEFDDNLFGQEDELLRSLQSEAQAQSIPQIQAPSGLARLLQIYIVVMRATAVLEIGTLFGHTSILMGRVLPPDGKLITLEVNLLHARIARENLRRAHLDNRVEVREGDALASLTSLAGSTFDLVFIDADKRSYPRYLAHVLDLTRSGSIIIADNVWRGGAVVESEPDDEDNRGLSRFTRELASDSRLLTTLFATRDCADAASISVRI